MVDQTKPGLRPHTLLELLKYIIEDPENSERSLQKLRKPVKEKPKLTELLIYWLSVNTLDF